MAHGCRIHSDRLSRCVAILKALRHRLRVYRNTKPGMPDAGRPASFITHSTNGRGAPAMRRFCVLQSVEHPLEVVDGIHEGPIAHSAISL